MDALTKLQGQRISEILGNISVAWFSAGAIIPFTSHPNIVDFVANFIVSFVMSIVFFVTSLSFAKK